jgi:NAD(P)-dependent dehydrogenase (short-subunit alcohol dehydrogenase family)
VEQVKDFDDDEWDFIMDVNLKGFLLCIHMEILMSPPC